LAQAILAHLFRLEPVQPETAYFYKQTASSMRHIVQTIAFLSLFSADSAPDCQGHDCLFQVPSLLQSKHKAAGKFVAREEQQASLATQTKDSKIRQSIHRFAAVAGLDVQQDWSNNILGHTAVGGPNLKLLRVVNKAKGPAKSRDDSRTCEDLKQKFLDVLNADEQDGTADASEEADGEVLKAAAATGDTRALKAMYDMLTSDHTDIREELKTDEFITHDDIKHIWSCETGKVPKLDESTDDDKYQGDMVFPVAKRERPCWRSSRLPSRLANTPAHLGTHMVTLDEYRSAITAVPTRPRSSPRSKLST